MKAYRGDDRVSRASPSSRPQSGQGGRSEVRFIERLRAQDTCYCPFCGSNIIIPLSELDSRLAVVPKYACCQAVYDWLRETIEAQTDAPRGCKSETLDEEAASGLSALFG